VIVAFVCYDILQVIIMLHGDPLYKFIHVEDFGYVVSYSPRTSFGDFQSMLPVCMVTDLLRMYAIFGLNCGACHECFVCQN
jgi:hypothetical protein